jgi:FdhE protein
MMTELGAPRPFTSIPIGEEAKPPFAVLPEPRELFARRAERLKSLAREHGLGPFLLFLAGLAEAQHRVQDGLPEPTLPPEDARNRARDYGMPPLDRNRFAPDAAYRATLERLLGLAQGIAMPPDAQAALDRVAAMAPQAREAMARAVLADAVPIESLAEHAFVAAALQVHFARLAAKLDVAALVPVGDGACPVCGAPPLASMVVGWQGAHGTRFCACSLCGTFWNYVRIKCVLCGSTGGIAYQEVDGTGGTVKAETCESCRAYVKVLHQHLDRDMDPLADDAATLGLDLLMRDAGFRRGGVNPFLLGY